MCKPFVELVVVVDAGGGLDPERPAGKPQAQREVDVLVVEEERVRHLAGGEVRLARDREAGAGDEAGIGEPDRLARGELGERLAGVAGPGDAGEVEDPAAGVDALAALRGDERLPGGPAAALGQRPLDPVAPAGLDDGVGVEEDEELAGRRLGAAVAGGGEAEVRAGLDHPRRRRQAPRLVRAPVGGGVVDDDQLVAVAKLRRRAAAATRRARRASRS